MTLETSVRRILGFSILSTSDKMENSSFGQKMQMEMKMINEDLNLNVHKVSSINWMIENELKDCVSLNIFVENIHSKLTLFKYLSKRIRECIK